MTFEHFALNVIDINGVVNWYCTHLGLTIANQQRESPYMTFLADSTDRVVIEFYKREDELAEDFSNRHPLTFHIAFVSENAEEDKQRLLNAGASYFEEILKEDGSHLVMLRDPWGMPLQLCQRALKF
ncbi:Glyoxalase-like domain-containing protein [Maribacter orientalis]|uniref:Glyoxalase-like domain-containing protein n=1 Tax=Maribacter orientalis TaxID=228957 RepID=A0A1H7RF60_9FLAO|nr:VOC family protein [Maribacter orientalis]SEL58813.1 Glyoxalase-like domain-containing protein [Maribacter orientalis]